MNKSEEAKTNPSEENQELLQVEPIGTSLVEDILRGIMKSYQDAWSKNNEKHEIKYTLTITNHKLATPEGNKDVAYLRLDRFLKEKGFKTLPGADEAKPPIQEEHEWEDKLIHQEIYVFKNMAERVNPKAPWKEQLFLNCLGRLLSAGLEYAELLQRLKQVEEGKKILGTEEEKRLDDIGLVKATEMPKPLSKDDEEYKKWLTEERKKEGVTQ